MIYYVSQENVTASINYFKSAGFDSDDMLFLFLLSKHFGITASYPVTYLVGQLSDSEKKEYLTSIFSHASSLLISVKGGSFSKLYSD